MTIWQEYVVYGLRDPMSITQAFALTFRDSQASSGLQFPSGEAASPPERALSFAWRWYAFPSIQRTSQLGMHVTAHI